MKALLLLLLVGSASAENVWQHAIEQGSPDADQSRYDSDLKSGDEQTMLALSGSISRATQAQILHGAIAFYRSAAQAKPNEPEVYYKIGRVLYSFYFEACDSDPLSMQRPSLQCQRSGFDTVHAKEIIEAWDRFEQLAPLDPRVSVERGHPGSVDFDLIFHRAILHTKFGDRKNLDAAIRDYERILHRTDRPGDIVLSNLAETYMMLGRLDDSIEMYRRALLGNANVETAYGLAVALDRDERGDQAADLVIAQGLAAMKEFTEKVNRGTTFFVPPGEENYYYALAFEAFGQRDNALVAWQRYQVSEAAKVHPEYAPRVKQHIDRMVRERGRGEVTGPLPDTPWLKYIP
ncbi:MAG TPA: tetratricopeptide repeat protein [Kofleriaceae bacterium]